MPMRPQLPAGINTAGLGLRGAVVHPSSLPASSLNGLGSPVQLRPAAGNAAWPPMASAPPLPLPVAAQAASHAAPALPVPSGPHSGVHWRADKDLNSVAGGMKQPSLSPVPSIHQGLESGQVFPVLNPGQLQPTPPVSVAALGSAAAESQSLGMSPQSVPDLSSLDESKQLMIGNAAAVARPHKMQQAIQSEEQVIGKSHTDGVSVSHPTAVNGFAHEPENRPQTLNHVTTG